MTVAAAPCPHCGSNNPFGVSFCEACGKAMPSATPAAPRVVTTDAAPISTAARGMIEADLHKQMKKASTALLIVAILQAIFGPVALMLAKSTAEREAGPGMVMEIEPIAYVIVFGLAVAFFALWLWSRVNPFAAAIVGLVLFVSVHLLDAVADPGQLVRGILVKIIVIVMLVQAIKAGLQYRQLRQQQLQGIPVA